jgi:Na+:H+ antiporter, NhaA family
MRGLFWPQGDRMSLPERLSASIKEFLDSEAAGGLVLMAAAALALIIANSPFAPAYFDVLRAYVGGLSVLHWINDALMAVFFLLVGLEIKREFIGGELATWPQRALPAFAAFGGMVIPALFYVALNYASPQTLRGWAIPSATDIAFALGILALLGNRVPVSLRIFLAALAIIDDLGAVIIIAVFYTAEIHLWALGGVALVAAALVGLNLAGVKRLALYLPLGAALWFFMYESGVHATLSGVVLALTIPTDQSGHSPLHRLEHALQKWVAFAIVPLFGFANAGVSLAGVSLAALAHPVTLGVAAGLFLGKQIGVFAATRLAVISGITEAPREATWAQVYGVSILCGVGFTMSLFIGLLAFPGDEATADAVKIGVLLGSLVSGLAGAGVLVWAGHQQQKQSL